VRLAGDATSVSARFDPPIETPALANQLETGEGACNGLREQMALEGGQIHSERPLSDACGDQAIALNLLPPDASSAAWFRRSGANWVAASAAAW